MTINDIKIDFKKDSHYILFSVLNTTHNWNVTKNDLKVMAVLYTKNEELRESISSHKDRMIILFSAETKKELMNMIDMPYNSFTNSLFNLRKKDLIGINEIRESKEGKNPWGISFNNKNYTVTLNFVNEPNK